MTNRVLLQAGAFKVSMPGVDVTRASTPQLSFSTDVGKGLLSYQTGTVNVPGAGSATINFPQQSGAPIAIVAGAWDGTQMYTGGFKVVIHAESAQGDDAEEAGEVLGKGLYLSWLSTKTSLIIFNHGPSAVISRYALFLTLFSY